MSEYIQRLIRCGYSPSDAYRTCYNFIKEFDISILRKFVSDLEKGV